MFFCCFFFLFLGSQEARVAKGGTGGTGGGAGGGGGVHNPSNRLPAGMLTSPVSFLISPDLKAVQLPSGLRRRVKYAVLTCLLYLPSSSRWPGGGPARCPERTDELCGGDIPRNPLTAGPVFITAIVALRGHEKDCCRQILFSGTTMKTVRGDETTDSKRQFSMPSAGHRERLFEACKVQMDSLAQHVPSKSEHFETKPARFCPLFSKGDSISLFWVFLGKTQLALICIFRALSLSEKTREQNKNKTQTSLDEKPEREKYVDDEKRKPKVAEEQSGAKTPTLFEFCSNLLPFEPKISHLSNLYTIPPLSIVYYLLCCFIVMVLSGIDVPGDYFSLNVAFTDTMGPFSWFLCKLDHVLTHCSTDTA